MKGLIYKEWCLGKKTFILFVVLSAVFTVLGMLVFLSIKYGNLKFMQEEPGSVKTFTYVFFYVPYVLMLLALEGCVQSVCTDYASEWMKYSYTLPLTEKKAVGARYVTGGIVLLSAVIYGIVNAGIIAVISGQNFDTDVVKNMLVILVVAVCIFGVIMPVAMLIKKHTTIVTIYGISFLIMYALMGVALYYVDKKYGNDMGRVLMDFGKRARNIISYSSVLIIAVVGYVSYIISGAIYRRREK